MANICTQNISGSIPKFVGFDEEHVYISFLVFLTIKSLCILSFIYSCCFQYHEQHNQKFGKNVFIIRWLHVHVHYIRHMVSLKCWSNFRGIVTGFSHEERLVYYVRAELSKWNLLIRSNVLILTPVKGGIAEQGKRLDKTFDLRRGEGIVCFVCCCWF